MLEVEKAIANLVEAGLRPEDAYETYLAVTVHVRGSVVLHRLGQNTSEPDGEPDAADTANTAIYRESTPLLAQSKAEDRRIGIPGDRNFEYVLQSILDRAQQQIERYRDPVPRRVTAGARQAGAYFSSASYRTFKNRDSAEDVARLGFTRAGCRSALTRFQWMSRWDASALPFPSSPATPVATV